MCETIDLESYILDFNIKTGYYSLVTIGKGIRLAHG
jgi:hypothetical protein